MINFINSLDNNSLLDILLLSDDATAIYTGEELRIELVNDAMLAIWGKDKSVLGQRFEDALPEMEGQQFTELLKKVWRTGESYKAQDTAADLIVNNKLQTFYFDFSYRAITDKNGKIRCILHTAVEVSERMRAWNEVSIREVREQEYREELAAANEDLAASNEQLLILRYNLENANILLQESNIHLNAENTALSAAEQKALSLFEDAAIAIGILTGPELIVSRANPELLKLWGKDIRIIGKPLGTALPELEGQPYIKLLQGVLHSGKTYHGNQEKVFIERNGELGIRYFNFIYKAIGNGTDKAHSIMLVATDVTDLVDAKRLVEEVNQNLNLALNAGKLGSYDLHIATGKMECSDSCKQNFGLQPDDVFNFDDLMKSILPEYRADVQHQVQTAISKNQIYSAEYEISLPNGDRRWIQAKGQPRYDLSGNPTRIVGVTVDISERKLYEQRKDDFLSIASHELKTPITVLRANLQMLERIKGTLDNPIATRLIENSTGSITKISSLIDDLLNINRYSKGKLVLHKTVFDVHQILEPCCSHLKNEDQHTFTIKASGIVSVFADKHRIEQVLINFVNNAVKYASGSKEIQLYTEVKEEYVRVCVRDFGKGIPKEHIPHLFERYWQANHSDKNNSGVGLGLYIAAEIIKQHDGEIGAESNLGEGSIFWFTLPL